MRWFRRRRRKGSREKRVVELRGSGKLETPVRGDTDVKALSLSLSLPLALVARACSLAAALALRAGLATVRST